ncbi:uncharacterized protein [Dermacentor albipictus]|uniref:uncharacterized protein n=1 Tax=Dermacentor albipictus TaxID=60249 RepID=UPI0038FCBE9C
MTTTRMEISPAQSGDSGEPARHPWSNAQRSRLAKAEALYTSALRLRAWVHHVQLSETSLQHCKSGLGVTAIRGVPHATGLDTVGASDAARPSRTAVVAKKHSARITAVAFWLKVT